MTLPSDFKIRTRSEKESAEVQRILFAKNCRWPLAGKKVQFTTSYGLTVRSEREGFPRKIRRTPDEKLFNSTSLPEILASDLLGKNNISYFSY